MGEGEGEGWVDGNKEESEIRGGGRKKMKKSESRISHLTNIRTKAVFIQ